MDINEKKASIIALIRKIGPVLPGSVSKEIDLSILMTSTLLSEMVSDKILKISYIKVGSSPLYYLSGQENMLEKFFDYLNNKEKEAFRLLRKKGVLEDSKLGPVTRVALRNLRDFAIPIKAADKIFWRFYSANKEDTIKKIKSILLPKVKAGKIGRKEKAKEKIERKKREIKQGDFAKKVYSFLQNNQIIVLEEKEIKKKFLFFEVVVPTTIEKIKFLVIAKDKKNINDDDLSLALQKGQSAKMPVLFLSAGKLTKKAKENVKNLHSYLFFKSL